MKNSKAIPLSLILVKYQLVRISAEPQALVNILLQLDERIAGLLRLFSRKYVVVSR